VREVFPLGPRVFLWSPLSILNNWDKNDMKVVIWLKWNTYILLRERREKITKTSASSL